MSAASLFEAGRLSFRASSFETAIGLFTQVRTLLCTPQHDLTLFRLQAIELSPAANYYDARASAYEKMGDLKSALLDAREVVRLLPGSYKVSDACRGRWTRREAHAYCCSQGYLRGGRLWRAAGKYERAVTMLIEGKMKVSLRDVMVQRVSSKMRGVCTVADPAVVCRRWIRR